MLQHKIFPYLTIQKLSLRYINKFPLGQREKRELFQMYSKYFQIKFNPELQDFEIMESHLLDFREIIENKYLLITRLVFDQNKANHQEKPDFYYLIDLKAEYSATFDSSSMIEILQDLHKIEKKAFFKSIKEKLITEVLLQES
ncbi:MAG: TIGR04255 family protein [Candidatus Lokiarchaeota archaeon]|nr:TIGR04255 family protein [Candidatus Harpocratesius repetitus]